MTSATLPPGPRAPSVIQTIGWWKRPHAFLERCRARYGKRFTIKLLAAPPSPLTGGPPSFAAAPAVGKRPIRSKQVKSSREGKVIPIATRTDTERSAAAHKAAATRKQNEAKRSRSARKAAETRARAQASRLKLVGTQAQRAADTALGGSVIVGETIADTVRPFTSPAQAQRQISRARRRAATELRKAERRGATARRRTQRELKRQRTQATRLVRRNRREAERRVGDVQSAAEEAIDRVESQARNLV